MKGFEKLAGDIILCARDGQFLQPGGLGNFKPSNQSSHPNNGQLMNGIRQSFLRFRQEAGGALRYGVGILCLYWLWGEHVLTVTGTSGPSMYPTLAAQGDFVLIANYYRRGRGIKVGDQVSVKHPLFTQMGAGKRVIGMPGDFVVRDPDMSVDAAMDGTMIQVSP